jgi:hypothetical protein
MPAKITQEKFLKVGITVREVRKRKTNITNKYKVSVLKELQLPLYNAFLTEQQFLKDYKIYKYRPKIKFGGHTECFSYDLYNILFPNKGIDT